MVVWQGSWKVRMCVELRCLVSVDEMRAVYITLGDHTLDMMSVSFEGPFSGSLGPPSGGVAGQVEGATECRAISKLRS